jgi:serine/threonine protein phosphatase PrpC
MKYDIANESRIGQRPYNQDRLGCWQTDRALLMALADGMGGHAHGALAADLAVGLLGEMFVQAARPSLADPDLFLFRAIGMAHAALCAHARDYKLSETPRTTIVACVVQDGCAYWTHVGDSRLYFIRGGEVLARTRDHTFVQALVDSGRLSEHEAETHPQRNVLAQCLGAPQRPRLEPAAMAHLRRGDTVLLCSDGFYGQLTTRDIGQGVLPGALRHAVAGLATMAEARAGRSCDNLSALAMTWQEESIDAASEAGSYTEFVRAPEPDYLALSDADIEREVERIKRGFRACSPPAAPLEQPSPAEHYMTDEEIEHEIERIRRAFRLQVAQREEKYLTDEEVKREIERIRQAFRRQSATLATRP